MAAARDPEFYLRHADYVRALARHVVFDRHLAEDVEQRVWLAALEHAPREIDSPRAWLKSLVRSFAIKAWRGDARRAQREESASRARQPVPTPAEIVEHENARRQVVDALLELDEPYRTALLLRFFEGLEPPQIAARLDLPLETVRTHLKRGLARLREKLERRRAEFGSSVALALVRAWRLEPPSYARAGAAAAKSLLQGALVVSAAHKFAIAAAAIVVSIAALWAWRRADVAMPSAANLAPAVDELAPIAQRDEAVASSTHERSEVATASTAPAAPISNADARFGSLLLHVVWADDKTSAPGVGLRLLLEHADDYYNDTLDVTSDADGNVKLERVLAGEVYARIDRGWTGKCVVEPAAHAEATIEVPSGCTLTGRVLDVDDRPFAGAELYLATWGGSYDGFLVGRSRDDGSFELRGLRPHTLASLSARAKNRAPTRQCSVIAEGGATIAVRLQFETSGGSLAGHVYDASGEPVANARVLAGTDAIQQLEQAPDGTLTKAPAAQRALTDAHGEFRFESLAPGRLPLQVRMSTCAPWQGEVDIAQGRESVLDVRLSDGIVLTGVVRDTTGQPVAGAEIWNGSASLFATNMCQSDASGAFTMRGLPLGEFAIDVDAGDSGSAHREFFGRVGAPLYWDVALSAGLALRGRVVAPGHDGTTWIVVAQTIKAPTQRWAIGVSTDADGRFEIDDCPDEPLQVLLRASDSSWLTRAVVENVRAGGDELVLTPDPTLDPSVRLRGRIVDAAGRPLAGAWFRPCSLVQEGAPLLASDADGRFDVGPYSPGEWTIRVQVGSSCSRSPTRKLMAGETWDFGDIRAEPGAQVVVEFDGACGPPDATTTVRMFDDAGWNEYLSVEGNRARSMLEAPGRYTLAIERDGCAKLERAIEVRAGEELRVPIVLSAR